MHIKHSLSLMTHRHSLQIILAMLVFSSGCAGGPRGGLFGSRTPFKPPAELQQDSEKVADKKDDTSQRKELALSQDGATSKTVAEKNAGEESAAKKQASLLDVISGRKDVQEFEGDPFLEAATTQAKAKPEAVSPKKPAEEKTGTNEVRSAAVTADDRSSKVVRASEQQSAASTNQFGAGFDEQFAKITEELRNPVRQGSAAPFPEDFESDPKPQPSSADKTVRTAELPTGELPITKPTVEDARPTTQTPFEHPLKSLNGQAAPFPESTPADQQTIVTELSKAQPLPNTSTTRSSKPGIVMLSETTSAGPKIVPFQPRIVIPKTVSRIPHPSSGVNSKRPRSNNSPVLVSKSDAAVGEAAKIQYAAPESETSDVRVSTIAIEKSRPIHPAIRRGIMPTVVHEYSSLPETPEIEITPASPIDGNTVIAASQEELTSDSIAVTPNLNAGIAERVNPEMIISSDEIPSRIVSPREFARIDIQSLQEESAPGTAPWIIPASNERSLIYPKITPRDLPNEIQISKPASTISNQPAVAKSALKSEEVKDAPAPSPTVNSSTAPAVLNFPTRESLMQSAESEPATEFSEGLKRQTIWVSANRRHSLHDGPLPYPSLKPESSVELPVTTETKPALETENVMLTVPQLNTPISETPAPRTDSVGAADLNTPKFPSLQQSPQLSNAPLLTGNPLSPNALAAPGNLAPSLSKMDVPHPPVDRPVLSTAPGLKTDAATTQSGVLVHGPEQRILNVENWEDEPTPTAKSDHPLTWLFFGFISIAVMVLVSIVVRRRTQTLRA